MLTKTEVIQFLKANSQHFKNQYGISKVAIFGSYASDTASQESDIDLIVDLDQPLGFKFYSFIEEIENSLNKKVDVLTMDGINSIRSEKIKTNIKQSMEYV